MWVAKVVRFRFEQEETELTEWNSNALLCFLCVLLFKYPTSLSP